MRRRLICSGCGGSWLTTTRHVHRCGMSWPGGEGSVGWSIRRRSETGSDVEPMPLPLPPISGAAADPVERARGWDLPPRGTAAGVWEPRQGSAGPSMAMGVPGDRRRCSRNPDSGDFWRRRRVSAEVPAGGGCPECGEDQSSGSEKTSSASFTPSSVRTPMSKFLNSVWYLVHGSSANCAARGSTPVAACRHIAQECRSAMRPASCVFRERSKRRKVSYCALASRFSSPSRSSVRSLCGASLTE